MNDSTNLPPLVAMDAALLVSLLERMQLLRAFDRRVGLLCKRKRLPGLIHLGIGEEAVAVGVCATLEPHDKITSTHRAHGHFLAKGGTPAALMAELYGKKTGCCRGKGGSMHLVDLSIGFLGANGVVGGGLPIAVGAALTARAKTPPFVTVCFFGDGANNQGVFHESLNLAAVWNLPVVFVCENNQFGISIHTSEQQKVANVADRACAYGIPGEIVDGNDVIAVYSSVGAAVRAARSGKGPALIECKTYRIGGHYEGDDQSYREKSDVQDWAKNDPIERFEELLIATHVLGAEEAAALAEKAERTCDEAVAFAENSAYPDLQEATQHVYSTEAKP